jgi:S-(hydroxymethyl)glutathione dehydrogenase / alcohol dehydrogenase
MTVPRYMRAAILTELRKPLTVAEVEVPQQLEAGQALIKLHYSGICGSQLGEIDGVKGEDKYLPHLLGHEGSGTVVDTGPGVKHVTAGDKVVLHWRKGLGIESVPPSYRWDGKKLNAGWITTFNEYAVVSENRVTAIPADSDLRVAALFGCAVTTGFGVVLNNAKLKIGESVVVFGAGGVGLNIVQAAALVSAYPIIAVDLYDNRLALAQKLGATHAINARSADARIEIAKILGSVGLDVFIDNTGNPDIIETGYQLVKSNGRVVLVGVPRAGNNVSLHSLPLHFGKTITGSHGGEALPQEDIPRYQRLASIGRIKLVDLLTGDFDLGEIDVAISKMRDGTMSGRCLIALGG